MAMVPVGDGFRHRLSQLASEHEELQKSHGALSEECKDLRAQLADSQKAVAELEAKLASSVVDAPLPSLEDVTHRDLPRPGKKVMSRSSSPLRLREAATTQPAKTARNGRRDVSERRSDDQSESVSRKRNPLALAIRRDGGDADARSDDGSSSYSSSSSSVSERRGGGRGRRKRRVGGTRRGHKGPTRRRRRARSRRRGRSGSARGSRSRSRSRKGGGRMGSAHVGEFGTGDHRLDLDTFISKNELEARVAHALRTMSPAYQKKVMGTDGGENSFLLIDRVKNPNAVVMSRIRKLEARDK